MHSQSIIAVAVGAAGIANGMPAVDKRAPQGFGGSNGYNDYTGGNQYGASKYSGGGQGGQGGGFPFSLLSGGGGAGGGFPGSMLSSVGNILPFGGSGGGSPLSGLGLRKRAEQKAQNGQNGGWGDDDDCEEQCEDYCDKYFDGQDWREQQCESYCPQACDNGNNGGYKPEGDPKQAFCDIWDFIQSNQFGQGRYGNGGFGNNRWNQGGFDQSLGQGGFQKRQSIPRIPPGFGPGPVVRPGQYGGGSNQQCPLWQNGGYKPGDYKPNYRGGDDEDWQQGGSF